MDSSVLSAMQFDMNLYFKFLGFQFSVSRW